MRINMSTKILSSSILVILFFLLFSTEVITQTISSNGTGGNWNNVATWVGGVVPGAGAVAETHVCVDAIGRLMRFGEHQVLGRATQHGVGALLLFGQDEELGCGQAADEDVAHLRCRVAAGEPVHVDAVNTEQLPKVAGFNSGVPGGTYKSSG